jgi:hypothetical protein
VVTDPVLSGNPARESAVGVTTIRRAELADDETSMTAANDLAVRRALESAGVEFIDGNKWWRRCTPPETPAGVTPN